jgi:hypothetical protein
VPLLAHLSNSMNDRSFGIWWLLGLKEAWMVWGLEEAFNKYQLFAPPPSYLAVHSGPVAGLALIQALS